MRPGDIFNPYRVFNCAFIPIAMLEYCGLTPGAKLCYARLCLHAGQRGYCWPKQDTLAKEIAVSDRQVRYYLSELETEGFILIIQRGLRRSNLYRFLWHPVFENSDWKNPASLERKVTSGLERKATSGQNRKDVAGPSRRGLPEADSKAKRASRLAISECSNRAS